MIKDVSVAHPTDTIIKTEASYVNLLHQMANGKNKSEPFLADREHFNFSLTGSDSTTRRRSLSEGNAFTQEGYGLTFTHTS